MPGAVGRRDRAALARATEVARGVPDPPGAMAVGPHDCNADGVVRCTRVTRDVEVVVGEVVAALRAQGHAPDARCDVMPVSEPLRSCHVRIGTGRDHHAWVWLQTEVVRAGGKVLDAGTLVNVSAS